MTRLEEIEARLAELGPQREDVRQKRRELEGQLSGLDPANPAALLKVYARVSPNLEALTALRDALDYEASALHAEAADLRVAARAAEKQRAREHFAELHATTVAALEELAPMLATWQAARVGGDGRDGTLDAVARVAAEVERMLRRRADYRRGLPQITEDRQREAAKQDAYNQAERARLARLQQRQADEEAHAQRLWTRQQREAREREAAEENERRLEEAERAARLARALEDAAVGVV